MKFFCSKCNEVFPVVPGDEPEINCPKCNAVMPRPENESSAGTVVGDFVIEKSISKGGMGEVFLARQISLDRPVALKILQKEFTNDPEYVESLFREARAAAKISHPNIVQAYAVGQDEGICYFAMELVRGDTLKNILRAEGALPAVKSAKIICDIANALDVAWREQKLVHQDIKPDNIMVDVNGFSKLADLGLAKTGGKDDDKSDESDEVLGTPQYISPEQLTGVPTDVRSDIYSLGATFYHIVTGSLPYRAADLEELARMHDAGNLTPPKEVKADLPDELNRIIVKMMARNIDERYQTPTELIKDLTVFINGGSKIVSPKLSLPGKGNLAAVAVVSEKSENASPAVPKIAVPPPAVSKPAIPPAVPKTVVPKPVVPSPAVPKPVVPKPVVPSPAVPKPVVPPPAVVPKPASPVAPAPIATGNGGSEKNSDGNKKTVKLILLISAGVIGLLVIAAGVMIALEKSGVMSPVITPLIGMSEKNETIAVESSDAAAVGGNTAGEIVPQPTEPVITPESTLETFTPAGRKEYMMLINELVRHRQDNPDDHAGFLRMVDNAWDRICYPITPVESEGVAQIKSMFSPVDELERCRSNRNYLRNNHISQRQRAEEALAEQKRQEAENLAEQRQRQQEMEREKQENIRLQKEADRVRAARRQKLIAEGSALLGECTAAMRDSIVSGDNAAYEEALEKLKTFANSTVTFSAEETAAMRRFKGAINAIPAEKSKLAKIFSAMTKVSKKYNIRIMYKNRSVPLLTIKSGELVFSGKNQRQESMKYSDLDATGRTMLFFGLEQRLKLKNSEFYSDLFHRKRPADNKVPGGFWKSVWPFVKQKM